MIGPTNAGKEGRAARDFRAAVTRAAPAKAKAQRTARPGGRPPASFKFKRFAKQQRMAALRKMKREAERQ